MPRLGMFRRAERQRVEAGDRARAHREDVAQDAADTRCRALIRLDVTWVIVAFHLEDHGLSIADIDYAGILTRALNHPWCFCREPLQMDSGGFVRTVFIPHR